MFRYYYQSTGPTFAETVLSLAPTAYWRLGDASGGAVDASGNGHDLTEVGTITYGTPGWTGDGDTAMTFGSGDALSASDHNDWDIGTNDFTIMWAHKIATGWPGADMQIIGHPGQGYAGEFFLRIRSAVEDSMWLRIADATTGQVDAYIFTAANVIDSGSWVFCVLTGDRSGNATLYVDGTTLGGGSEQSASISSGSSYDVTNAQSLYVGNNNISKPVVGDLDEVAYWNGRLLTQLEVQQLYDASGVG